MKAKKIIKLTQELLIEDTPKRCDVLVVMGTPHSQAPLVRKISQIISNQSPCVVVVSGFNGEAENIIANCILLGLPAGVFRVENKAKNTSENISHSLQLIKKEYPERSLRIAFLAKDYALLRCRLTAEKILPKSIFECARFYSFSVFRENLSSFFKNEKYIKKIITELRKVVEYSELNWISKIPSSKYQHQEDLNFIINGLEKIASESKELTNKPESCRVSEISSSTFQDIKLSTLKLEFCSAGVIEHGSTSIVSRPESVGVILYCFKRDRVFLIEQFRAANSLRSTGATSIEIVAGYQDNDETLENTAIRETHEETTLTIKYIFPVTSFFPAPTLSSEMIHLFFGIVESSIENCEEIYHPREHTKVISYTPIEILDLLINNHIKNSLTILALQKAAPYFKMNFSYLYNQAN